MYKFQVWNEENDSEIEIMEGLEDSVEVETEDIPRTIQGKQFADFLDICFQRASFFSLKKANWTSCIDASAEKELKPFLVKQLTTSQWFCYDLSLAPLPSQRFLQVNIYCAKPEAKAILLKYFSDIFLREKKGDALVDSTQTVEDLCIFSTNSLLVGTVSHEFILHVYPPDKDFESSLDAFGTWIFDEDIQEENINLSQVI